MSFKKFGKRQLKVEIKKIEEKIKNKCKRCGYKTKILKSKFEHVICQNKFCKKKTKYMGRHSLLRKKYQKQKF